MLFLCQEEPLPVMVVTWWDRITFKHLYIMIQTKQLYLSPTTETLVVQVEEALLTGSQWNSSNNTENLIEDGDVIGL